jgi:WS/DGAT/MGAT family acyltransferase
MWEIYVIEGLDRIPNLPKGSFALFLKFHHAAIDGEAGVELLKAIHSPAPDADASESRQALYAERDPTSVELYSRALAHGAVRAVQLSSVGVAGLARVARAGVNRVLRRGAADRDAEWLPPFAKAPPTRFNRQVSANRVVDAVALPLDALKRAQAKLGDVSINDLFLAVVGGALRRYLGSKDELPDRSLTALMPLGTRADAPAGVSTHVDGMPVALHTEVADPVERVRAVRRDADAAKRSARAIGRGLVHALVDALPQVAIEKIVRHYVVPQLNVTVSNIRGPDATLYVAGARLVHFYPVSIATDYVGLNHTGFSYNGVLWISAVACRNMLPDPGFYADCLRESFDELIAAADAAVPLARARPVAAARRGRRATAGAKPPAAHVPPQTAVRRTGRRAS